MAARLVRLLISHPLPVFMLLAAATVLAGFHAARIRFDFTPQAIFAGNDEIVTESERFKRMFGYNDSVLLILLEAVGEQDVLARPALVWQLQAVEAASDLAATERVEAIVNLQLPKLTLTFPPRLKPRPLISDDLVDDAREAKVRKVVDESPLLEDSLISRDRRLTSIAVRCDPQARDIESMQRMCREAEQMLAALPPPPGYRVHLSGLPALRVDIVRNLEADQQLLLPLAAGLYLAALAVAFRRFSGSVLPLIAVGVGLVWTIGLMSAAGESFNVVSNILPVLLLIIGVSNCVHVVSRYGEEAGHYGSDRRQAVWATIHHMTIACLLTFLTTAVGFFSLLAARSDALQGFGWQASAGMLFLYLSIIGTMGAALPFLRAPRRIGLVGKYRSPITVAVIGFGYLVSRHPRLTTGLNLVLIALALWSASRVEINSFSYETYDKGHPTLRTMQLVEEKLGGLLPLEIVLTADDPERFSEPEVYGKVTAVSEFAAAQPEVLFARSYVDLLQEVYSNMKRDESLRDELPAADPDGRRRIERTQKIVGELGPAVNYGRFMTEDGRHARIMLRVRDEGTQRLLRLIGDLRGRLAEQFPPESGIEFALTGDGYLNAVATDNIIRDLVQSLGGATVIIFGIIALLFRSLRVGLIAVLPNLTPLTLTLGYMGLRGYDMNVGNVIVFTISLGIAVDGTIHYLFRFREEARQHRDKALAASRACHGTGRAIVVTSALIVSGLAVLLLSEFVPTRRFAELTSLTMAGALLGDLLLLPACLVLFWKRETGPEMLDPQDSGKSAVRREPVSRT